VARALGIFLLSAASLALELALMRCLLVARWHHFSYFVISTALLGWGASGTVLVLTGRWLFPRARAVLCAAALLFAVAAPICLHAALGLPIDTHEVAYRLSQGGWLLVFHLLLLVPFFFAGGAVGLALSAPGADIRRLYGANLLGSGLGAAGGVGLMLAIAPEYLPLACGVLGVASAILLGWPLRRGTGAGVAVGAVALVAWSAAGRFDLPVDVYKTGAYLQRLVAQGAARRVVRHDGPRGRVELWEAHGRHVTLFALPDAPPAPPQRTLTIDGSLALPLFDIPGPDAATIMDFTPMALAYRLAPRPRVLLLGEIGGGNVWLARRMGAETITVVTPDAAIFDVWRRFSPQMLDQTVTLVAAEPRAFLAAAADRRFDLIQVCELEGMAAGTSGLLALHENYLMTAEGLARALERLAPGGVISVTRGLQLPPRDNVKLLTLAAAAVTQFAACGPPGSPNSGDASSGPVSPRDSGEGTRERGVPGRHVLPTHGSAGRYVVQVRNYLAACTLIGRDPFDAPAIDRLHRVCDQMGLDLTWHEGLDPARTNRFDVQPGPPDSNADWLSYAARRIYSPQRETFVDEWAYEVAAPTDDRPFFFDFCKWRSLPMLWRQHGRQWLAGSEWGSIVLAAALIESIVAAAVLILLPLRWLRAGNEKANAPRVPRSPCRSGSVSSRRSRGRASRPWHKDQGQDSDVPDRASRRVHGRPATLAYFGLLGAAFLSLEMNFIQRITAFIGDPIHATAIVLGGFLAFSGLGSLLARRWREPSGGIVVAIGMIVLIGGAYLIGLPAGLARAAGAATGLRMLLSLAVIAPLALFMGMPMPLGLSLIAGAAGGRRLVPWAWGINGFFAVIATSAALMLAMAWGLAAVGWSALAAYATAAVIHRRLPRASGSGSSQARSRG